MVDIVNIVSGPTTSMTTIYAAGTTSEDATPIVRYSSQTAVWVVPDGGVKLPNPQPADVVEVYAYGGNSVTVYPHDGGSIAIFNAAVGVIIPGTNNTGGAAIFRYCIAANDPGISNGKWGLVFSQPWPDLP